MWITFFSNYFHFGVNSEADNFWFGQVINSAK